MRPDAGRTGTPCSSSKAVYGSTYGPDPPKPARAPPGSGSSCPSCPAPRRSRPSLPRSRRPARGRGLPVTASWTPGNRGRRIAWPATEAPSRPTAPAVHRPPGRASGSQTCWQRSAEAFLTVSHTIDERRPRPIGHLFSRSRRARSALRHAGGLFLRRVRGYSTRSAMSRLTTTVQRQLRCRRTSRATGRHSRSPPTSNRAPSTSATRPCSAGCSASTSSTPTRRRPGSRRTSPWTGTGSRGSPTALARTLRPDWHCLDIGANHGYYTLVMADAVGPEGRVVPVEPTPRAGRAAAPDARRQRLPDMSTSPSRPRPTRTERSSSWSSRAPEPERPLVRSRGARRCPSRSIDDGRRPYARLAARRPDQDRRRGCGRGCLARDGADDRDELEARPASSSSMSARYEDPRGFLSRSRKPVSRCATSTSTPRSSTSRSGSS